MKTYSMELPITQNDIDFATHAVPEERFVEYEPSDMAWMIPLGMATERHLTPEQINSAADRLEKQMEIAVFRKK